MPQVFQQTLWVGGIDEEGESQEVVWPSRERDRARKGSALFRLGLGPGGEADETGRPLKWAKIGCGLLGRIG